MSGRRAAGDPLGGEPALRLEGVGKEYRIGAARRARYRTLRESIGAGARDAARRVARLGRGPGAPDDTRFWALRDVSLEVRPGEAVGIVGGNGAGKSTLLKVLSRITEPSAGTATIRGRVGSLLEVGTGFHPELTGRENVFLNGALLGMPRREIAAKFEEIVEFSEVGRFLDTPVKHYSSGMYVRLAFAVAAHLESEVLLVDEVLAVGDSAFQAKCLGRMNEVTGEGRAVLFVSHDLDAVARLCSRAVLLERGAVAADGPTPAVVARYLTRGAGRAAPGAWLDVTAAPRRGSGAARFTAVRYTSRPDVAAGRPHPGGPLDVTLRIDAREARRAESLAVTIRSPGGTVLVNADTLSLGAALQLRPGGVEVQLRIAALHLSPGLYAVGLWLAQAMGETFDHVEAAFELEVVAAEPPRLGAPPSTDGAVPCRFTLVAPNDGAPGGGGAA